MSRRILAFVLRRPLDPLFLAALVAALFWSLHL